MMPSFAAAWFWVVNAWFYGALRVNITAHALRGTRFSGWARVAPQYYSINRLTEDVT
jgi:hypothetical protein